MKADVRKLLIARHDKEDFTLITQQAVMDSLGGILHMLSLAISGIAAISLVAAGILITNVMLYWVTNSFWSAIRLYSESYYHPWELPAGARIEVPTGVAAYPHELAPIVRKRAERYYNVVHYTDYPAGGHFAIHERAAEMAEDLRIFFRPLRTS